MVPLVMEMNKLKIYSLVVHLQLEEVEVRVRRCPRSRAARLPELARQVGAVRPVPVPSAPLRKCREQRPGRLDDGAYPQG